MHMKLISKICTYLLLVGLPLVGSATNYSAESIEGWVIDAQSKLPVEGAVVVANWPVRGGIHGEVLQQLKILESVTDEKGRYFIPSWGPLSAAAFGRIRSDSPGMWIFKFGYRPLALSNWASPTDSQLRSDYNKKTVALVPFDGGLDRYPQLISQMNSSLQRIGYRDEAQCEWKNFPKMLRTLNALELRFREAGIMTATMVSTLKSNRGRLAQSGCGEIEEVLSQ